MTLARNIRVRSELVGTNFTAFASAACAFFSNLRLGCSLLRYRCTLVPRRLQFRPFDLLSSGTRPKRIHDSAGVRARASNMFARCRFAPLRVRISAALLATSCHSAAMPWKNNVCSNAFVSRPLVLSCSPTSRSHRVSSMPELPETQKHNKRP